MRFPFGITQSKLGKRRWTFLSVFLSDPISRFWVTFLISSCLHDICLSLGKIQVTITSAFGFLSNIACATRVRQLLMSSGLLWSMLLVPQCITATCKFLGNSPCLILHKMFWIQSPTIPNSGYSEPQSNYSKHHDISSGPGWWNRQQAVCLS